LAVILLALCTVVLVLNQRLGRGGRVRLSSGKGGAPRLWPLGRWRWAALGLVLTVAVGWIVLPMVAIFTTSLQPTFGAPMSWSSLTFGHWREVLGSARTQRAALTSFLLAVSAAGLVCAVGLAVAQVQRRVPRAGRLLEALAAWPSAVPGTVLALGLLVAFSQDIRLVLGDRVALVLALANSAGLVLLAYVAKHLILGARPVAEGLAQIDPSLAESARIFGAGPTRAFVDATLPLLWPTLLGAFVLAFFLCATELTMSVLLVPAGHDLLGTLLFELQSYADPAAAAVLASAFVLCVLGGLAAVGWARRRRHAGH
jgi:iron(III) transport system permease protein